MEEEGRYGTGALPLGYDRRDWMLHRIPEVAAMLPATPDSFSLRQYHTGAALNQGAEPSCVSFSSCHMQAMYESMEQKHWLAFAGHQLYAEAGGRGSNGVYSRDVLQIMQDKGAPLEGAVIRYKISAYAFVDFTSFDLGVQTIKSAIAVNRPIVLATMLPTDIGAGMNAGSGSVDVNRYHQVLGAAYSPDRFIFLNSWGSGYGDNGWGSFPWAYLARAENRPWLYAYTSVDAADTDIPPVPTPQPLPTPTKVTVTGYGRVAFQVPGFRPQQPFTLQGSGLSDPALSALVAGAPAEVTARGDSELTVLAPNAPRPVVGTAVVLRGGQAQAEGPPLVVAPAVTPNPTPTPQPQPEPQPEPQPSPTPPPRDLVLTARRMTTRLVVWVSDGHTAVPALVKANLAGVPLGVIRDRSTVLGPAIFSASWSTHGLVNVLAVADDSRMGSLQVQV